MPLSTEKRKRGASASICSVFSKFTAGTPLCTKKGSPFISPKRKRSCCRIKSWETREKSSRSRRVSSLFVSSDRRNRQSRKRRRGGSCRCVYRIVGGRAVRKIFCEKKISVAEKRRDADARKRYFESIREYDRDF